MVVAVLAAILIWGGYSYGAFAPQQSAVQLVSYSEIIQEINAHHVSRAQFTPDGTIVQVQTSDNKALVASLGPQGGRIQDALERTGVPLTYESPKPQGGGLLQFFAGLVNLIFPFILLLSLFSIIRGSRGGGSSSPFNFGKTKASVQIEPSVRVTFDDVAGVDEAKLELVEVVNFLKSPDRFTKVGAKIPHGVLLIGPPGTGKTLLARAVAGEAGVPFYSISGSEFVEMFVGVGASRVRDLFKQAKSTAPCIIFIDEIDAVGRQRGSGIGGVNDEREQTLNQLLTELDGFEGNTGIIVVGATNRPDVLDNALMRPGRFDRQVVVERPDYNGRLAILEVHARGKAFSEDVNFPRIARRTPGFSGADLANLLNEAAILAARRERASISGVEVMDAIDRIIAGAEKKGRILSKKKKQVVAYHEAGHALVGLLFPGYDEVQKISIIPRGMAGGLTWFSPNEEEVDSGLYTRSYFLSELRVALGGRGAEEVVFGADEITNGASNDLQRVTQRARQMVKSFGMSAEIGPISLDGSNDGMFSGRDGFGNDRTISEGFASLVDSEIKRLITDAYSDTVNLLMQHRAALDELAALLIEKETVDQDELRALAARYGFGPDAAV
jgi:cell division protease FtsH